MKKGFPRTAAAVSALLILFPVAVASAGPYATTSVSQASSTSPFASCDISAFMFPGEVDWVNSELEPFVAVNPKDPTNIIGVYQQDRLSFGGASGLAASVSHDGGLSWSTTYPHFTTCSGGTAANHGDYQRASDPWITFSPDGTAYFISLSLTFAGDATQTGSAILVSKSTDGGDTWSEPVTLQRNIGDADVAPYFFNDKESITADPFDSNYVYAIWDRLRKPGKSADSECGKLVRLPRRHAVRPHDRRRHDVGAGADDLRELQPHRHDRQRDRRAAGRDARRRLRHSCRARAATRRATTPW